MSATQSETDGNIARRMLPCRRPLVVALPLLIASVVCLRAQSLSLDRQRGEMMLDTMLKDLRDHYYDPALHGVDVESRIAAAKQRIRAAGSTAEVLSIVAQVPVDLADSHTRFLPPARSIDVDYGWSSMFVGDAYLVRSVDPHSDAAKQGLHAGDQVLQIGQFTPTRRNEPLLWYLLTALKPQPMLRLVVQPPGASARTVDLASKITQTRGQIDTRNENDVDASRRDYERRSKSERRHELVSLSNDVQVWRMPYFDLDASDVDRQFDKVGRTGTLILDLRGNVGGSEETMLRVLGNLFDKDVVVGELREKAHSRSLVAKTRGHGRTFSGKLFVLVDSDSASASEVVARAIQLEQRGTVAGDRSAGAVMRAAIFQHQLGVEVSIYWAMEVTTADLVHPDGKSLEHVGVVPDILVLPSQEDLAQDRDPVLAQVASSLGIAIDASKAAALFAHRND